MNFAPQKAVKINLRVITKNNEAGLEKGFLRKSISKPYCRATAKPRARELMTYFSSEKFSAAFHHMPIEYVVQFLHFHDES